MSASAIVMMLIAMLVLWGGLGIAIWNIRPEHNTSGSPNPGNCPSFNKRSMNAGLSSARAAIWSEP